MPKVSVIVPVYGVEKYIERCARSLFEQTLSDMEYIFIDDCTRDKSIEVLQRVLEDYPHRREQVTIHRMEQNSGQAMVRTWGIQHSTGDYLIHCDPDDWVDINMYQVLYDKAIETDADIVLCEHYRCHEDHTTISNHHYIDDKFYLMFNFTTLWERLIRRSIFIDNKILYPVGNMGEDHVIVTQASWYAKKHVYVDKPLYYYGINESSISYVMDKNKALINFSMRKKNADIIEEFIQNNRIKAPFSRLVNLRLGATNFLIPFINDADVYSTMWSAYPGLLIDVLLSKGVRLRYKIAYLLAYFHIHIAWGKKD